MSDGKTLDQIDRAAARAHARAVVDRSGTSFGFGMRILPKAKRAAMFAVYAFCREIDDIADEDGAVEEKLRQLDLWREEIARLYEGRASLQTGEALLGPIGEFDLPREEFLLLIEGMEMDARGPIVAPDWQTLKAYCRRVAGAVGMLSIRIFGDHGAQAQRFALALGEALQLTNILRDVGEDAGIGRLYLPREVLEAHGVPTDDPKAAAAHPAIAAVCREVSKDASERFTEARDALQSLDWRVMRPALVMMGVYEGLFRRMEAKAFETGPEPVKLGRCEKMLRALRYAMLPPPAPPSKAA